MMKARYVRVSTQNQNLERQLVKSFPNEKLFIDKVSGNIEFKKRGGGCKLLESILNKEINYVTVDAIDRLGRNLFDLINTLKFFEEERVCLKVENLGIESLIDGKENPTFNLITSVMINISVMERTSLLQRQREGIEIAKLKGSYKGRHRGTKESEEDFVNKYKGVVKLLKQGFSIRKVAKLEDLSSGTVMKVKKLMK